jgi:hypothetical protein
MKAHKTILTHAAVFSVGIALAVVAQRPDTGASDDDSSDAGKRRVSSSKTTGSTAADSGSESRSASSRERRDGQELSSRTPEAIAQRLTDIAKTGDPLERQAALMDLVKRLGPDEFAAVADQYREMDHFRGGGGEYEIILRGWAKADPLAALEYSANHGNSRENTSTVLAAWAGNDAAAAEQWALANHKGDGPNPHLPSIIRGIAAYDLAHAARLAESMPNSRERGDAMETIARALFVQGADAAMAYPATIQDPQMRAGYVSIIAERLANKDAEKAATWLASVPDADSQVRGARHVAAALSRQDVAQAATWVKKLSPAAQAEAARGVIQPMSAGDITGTAKWVSTLNGIPNYDRVVEEFVWSCDYRSPEQSAAWIQGVANEEQRTRLYHRMLGEWAKRDANAVKNWVASNQVPGSVASRFKK